MKILLGLSGGLDSSYAAKLLTEGHEVEGAVLLMHGSTDIAAAERSAEEAGIKLHVLDRREIFRREVEEYFISEYRKGRTPNPCTMCNPKVKIGELCRFAADNGFDQVSTGHYARVDREDGRYCIAMGADLRKDQSYMLWGLTQEQLKMLRFPLADLTKDTVREGARELGLASAEAKESQDICFIPDGDYAAFLESRTAPMPEGNFVDANGKVLGKHKGILNYTVGQRRGLGIATGQRMFVSEIRPETNEILLLPTGAEEKTEMTVSCLNFQLLPPPETDGERTYDLECKIRYAAPPVPVKVRFVGDEAKVTFPTPIRAITPGQSAVFYQNKKIAFGGIIN